MAKQPKPEIKVHDIVKISSTELFEHPKNKNKQNRHTFKELQQSIIKHGFDESIIVVRKDDGQGYRVASGNHRVRAGKSLGMQEFPAVIHDDWDSAEQQIQLLRRNMVRGDITKEDFTLAVNAIEAEGATLDEVRERLGFEDPDQFAKMYQEEREQEEKQKIENLTQIAQNSRMTEDLGIVIAALFEKYGDTIPMSYIIFSLGGRNHLFCSASPVLRKTLDVITQKCAHDGMDINVALGGLLQIGMHESQFRLSTSNTESIVKAGTGEGPSDLINPKDSQ